MMYDPEHDELLEKLKAITKATVEHNKYLHAHRYDFNQDALRALGRID